MDSIASWSDVVEHAVKLITVGERRQWRFARFVWENFAAPEASWSGRMDDLAAAIKKSPSYCYEVARIWDGVREWARLDTRVLRYSIARLTVDSGFTFVHRLLDHWMKRRPGEGYWAKFLGRLRGAKSVGHVERAGKLLRSIMRCDIPAETAMDLELRKMAPAARLRLKQRIAWIVTLNLRLRSLAGTRGASRPRVVGATRATTEATAAP